MNLPEVLENRTVRVGEDQLPPLGLKSFFLLEYLRKSFIQSITDGSMDNFSLLMHKILSLYKLSPKSTLFETMMLVSDIIANNTLDVDLAFLSLKQPNKNKSKNIYSWEYDYSYIIQWIHLLAKNYNWDLKTIENIDPNFAAHLIQEILVEEQLRKEWEYSLTEFAYKYDSQSKKSTFQPLARPHWMQVKVDATIKKEKMLKVLMPHGVVVLSGIETPNAIEYIQEKTNED